MTELWQAQAELSADPADLAAWHRTAVGLAQAGDKAAAKKALAELAEAAGEVGLLPMALSAAKELEKLDPVASRKAIEGLAGLYGRGSKRVDAAARPRPPGTPQAAQPGPAPGQEAIVEAARTAVTAAATRARAQRGGKVPAYPLFSALEPQPFIELAGLLSARRVARGTRVIEQGQPGSSIFIIAHGVVRISRGEHTLAFLRGGAFFGEMALLTRQPRSASALCETDVVLFEVERSGLEGLASRYKAAAEVLAEYCRRRLLENLVATSPLFRDLPADRRGEAIARFRSRTLEPDAVLVSEGQPGDGLYVLVTGGARVEKSEGNDVLQLAELAPGDVFGEISLVRSRPATATVKTTARTVALFLPREEFDALAQSHPALAGAALALAALREKQTAQAMGAPATPADDCLV